jgi:hypothetical protein
MPDPIAAPLCTTPSTLPRSLGFSISPSSTAPTAHSAPKPMPWSRRAASSSLKLCAKPETNEKKENQAIVNCRMRARP